MLKPGRTRLYLNILTACVLTGVAMPPALSAQSLTDDYVNAEKGDPLSMLRLGIMYYNGSVEGRDPGLALHWFQAAAAQTTHPQVQIEANSYLGRMYLDGWGVPQNVSEAFSLLRGAAAENSTSAFVPLAKMYEEGLGTDRHLGRARYWYNAAASRGVNVSADLTRLDKAEAEQFEEAASRQVGPPPIPPPVHLGPNEVIRKTSQNCQVIVAAPGYDNQIERQRLENTPMNWSGLCKFGLAHGQGNMDGQTRTYQYGTLNDRNSNEYSLLTYKRSDAYGYTYGNPYLSYLELHNITPASFRAANWATNARLVLYDTPDKPQRKSLEIYTAVHTCKPKYHRQMNRDQIRALAGLRCGGDTGEPLYAVEVRDFSTNTLNPDTKIVFCPVPNSPQNCSSAWAQAVNHYASKINIIDNDVAQASQLMNDRNNRYQAHENEITYHLQSKKAYVDRMYEDRKLYLQQYGAEINAESGRLAAGRQMAAEKAAQDAKENHEKQIRSSVANMNPGQMLARADELDQQGLREDARIVRRELLSRHPNHPLAAIAAEKLGR